MQRAWLRHALRLRDDRAYRLEQQACLVVGHHAVTEYGQVKQLVVTERYLSRHSTIRPNLILGEEAFARLSRDPRPEGIMAEVPLPKPWTDKIPDCSLLLWRWQDARNLGAINRTALAMGIQLLINGGGGVDPWGLEAIKAARGATLRLPQAFALPQTMPGPCVHKLPSAMAIEMPSSFVYLLADPHGESISQIEVSEPWCLVLGSEHHGLRDLPPSITGRRVSIPMRGPVESLNVATAGALLLYELTRK